ncbi:MAG: hypothetical protein F4073_06865 [Rhodobacteraceae bacterium]|nr:hypothetical protein [Paracoccaceae bacterium]MYF45331.1 hypothetical protein [Paracoccaceae bacterium]MYI91657.1 hypothetical protein [Paracoccaceae bacterium]
MWMFVPLSFATLFIMQLVPDLEREDDENYKSRVVANVLVGIQKEAVAYGEKNRNFAGPLTKNEIHHKTPLNWHSEIVQGKEGRHVLTWLDDLKYDQITNGNFMGLHELRNYTRRPDSFWGKYSVMGADSIRIGKTVVPQPKQMIDENIFILGEKL